MLRLLHPNPKYIRSVFKAHHEQYQHGEITKEIWDETKSEIKDPVSFVKTIRNKSKDKGLAPGQLPFTRYWLIDGDEYIGTLRLSKNISQEMKYNEGNMGYQIRPSKRKKGYGSEVLRLGLLKAKKIGLKQVYLNCSVDNTASQKIIKKNRGRLINNKKQNTRDASSLHYVIDLK